MPHGPSFAICVFLEEKIGGRTKNATKMITQGRICSVLKGHDQFRELIKTQGPKM